MFETIRKLVKYRRITNNYPQTPIDKTFGIGRPIIDTEMCDGCDICREACPSEAITIVEGKAEISLDKCIFCGMCEDVCIKGAALMSHDIELATGDKSSLVKSDNRPMEKGIKSLQADKEDTETNASQKTKINHSYMKISDDDINKQDLSDIEGRLSRKIKKIYGRSLQIREVDAGSCNGCDYEVNATCNPLNDIEKLGVHFVASPRHADMLLVTGPVSRNMEEALLKTYQATPSPKLVVAVGACACSGGIFRDSYAVQNGVDKILPVDVYIPGCPPRPAAIIYGILKALEIAEDRKKTK